MNDEEFFIQRWQEKQPELERLFQHLRKAFKEAHEELKKDMLENRSEINQIIEEMEKGFERIEKSIKSGNETNKV